MKKRLILTVSVALLLTSCMVSPFITAEYVDRKFSSISLGVEREVVIKKLGHPHYVTTLTQEDDLVEIWEYQVGNFTYYETGSVLLRNGKVVGLPKNHHELIQLLHLMRIIDQAQFSDLRKLRQTTSLEDNE